MSEVRRGRARSTTGRAGSVADGALAKATDADAPDAPEVLAAEVPVIGGDGGSEAGSRDNARAGSDVEAVSGPVEPAAVESGALVVGDAVGWADVVPLLALRVGSAPTAGEVRFAPVVWQMLGDDPGRTVLQMAADAELRGVAGLDPATLGRVLARYERSGVARAVNGGPVSRWFVVDPAEFLAGAQQETDGVGAAGARTPRAATGARVGSRVAPGGLRGMVEDHLAEHPFQDFSPSQLSRELGGRSSGAIANALERLVEMGSAIRTSEAPRRYQHRPDPDAVTAGAVDASAADGPAGSGADTAK